MQKIEEEKRGKKGKMEKLRIIAKNGTFQGLDFFGKVFMIVSKKKNKGGGCDDS